MANTSIVISFGSDSEAAAAANAHLSAEVDSRPTGLNGGRTNFKPGEVCWFLIYMSDNVQLDGEPISSAGTITAGATVTGINKTQEIVFNNEDSSSIQVPSTGITTTKWLGRSLGALTLIGNKATVKAGSKGVAVAKVTYTCNAKSYSITAPAVLDGETSFSIAILVNGLLKDV
jgi:hypothetical protein